MGIYPLDSTAVLCKPVHPHSSGPERRSDRGERSWRGSGPDLNGGVVEVSLFFSSTKCFSPRIIQAYGLACGFMEWETATMEWYIHRKTRP